MKYVLKIIGYITLILISAIMIVPFIYMVFTSFKVTYTAYNFDLSFNNWTIANYVQILSEGAFFKFFINSTIISIAGVILMIVFSVLAGYSFAQLEFKNKNQLFFYMIITLIIPSQVTMIPLYIIMRTLNWLNTFYALILPIPTAIGVFIIRQAMLEVPKDLIESAKIDGASELRILFQIVLPLIKSAVVALAIFTFVGAWNEFLWPLIATSDESVRTLTVGLSTLKARNTVNYGLVMAGATITFLPSFIIYIILQNKFVEGITLSGIKG